MDNFDPLFDEDAASEPAFSLALPTFEVPRPEYPELSSIFDDMPNISDQNVGTIALSGSHRSEQSSVYSNSPIASHSTPSSDAQTTKRSGKGRKSSSRTKKKKIQPNPPPYKPSSVSEAVLGRLAKDPNVIPLLQSIVEYVYRTNLQPAPTTASPQPGTESRPAKRRRLYRVPAGAEDWTVPFPFREGEGPLYYRETWQMKRLTVLLGSLMRGLKDWTRRKRAIVVDTSAPARASSSRGTPRSSEAPSTSGESTPTPSQLPKVIVPDPSGLDITLDALLDLFNSFEQNNQSLLNVDVGALSSGSDLSQVLYTTASDVDQGVLWDQFITSDMHPTTLLTDLESTTPLSTDRLDPLAINLEEQDVRMVDDQSLSPTVQPGFTAIPEMPTAGSSRPEQLLLGFDAANSIVISNVGTEETSDVVHQAGLNSASGDVSNLDQPPDSAVDGMDLDPPPPSVEVPHSSSINPPSISPGIAVTGKRGRGKTSLALRRSVTLQARKTGSENPVPTTTKSVLATPNRASAATIERRQELLDRAKQWREVLAKELEQSRSARWEVMMEGQVLREISSKTRDPNDRAQ